MSEPTLVVVVTGLSGAGKSTVLHALEDLDYFCVDNLPPELLRDFLRVEQQRTRRLVAIAVDVRSAESLPLLLEVLDELRSQGTPMRALFLDASTEALVRRFSESRRPHPLTDAAPQPQHGRRRADPVAPQRRGLIDAIELERTLLAKVREVSTVVDTSQLRPAQLRGWIHDLVRAEKARLTLIFESFAFKHGVPLDADFVFDVRVLPNPHYVEELRPLSGRDAPVAQYLRGHADVNEMMLQIDNFISRWLSAFEDDLRSYLTVAIGCTGGQHRSVYLVESLAYRFGGRVATLIRHRELDARG